MGCWWPCCQVTETYNIRRYDRDGNVEWSDTIMDGGSVLKIRTHDAQFVYARSVPLDFSKLHVAKYDITSTPTLVWGKTLAEIRAIRAAESTLVITDFDVDGDGNMLCLVQASLGGSGLTGGKYVFKLRASDGECIWVRELVHTVPAAGGNPAFVRYWAGNAIACDSAGNSYIAHNQTVLERTGPSFFWFRYVNLAALNSDSSLKWHVSSDISEAVIGYHSTYQPPNLTSVDTEGTRVAWGCNAPPSQSPLRNAIGTKMCSDGSESWAGEPGVNIRTVRCSDGVVEKLLSLKGVPPVLQARDITTGVVADTISSTSGKSFLAGGQYLGPRKNAGAVARLAIVQGAGGSIFTGSNGVLSASIWEDIQAGASKYTKLIDLDYGGATQVTVMCVDYLQTGSFDDHVLVAGQLITA